MNTGSGERPFNPPKLTDLAQEHDSHEKAIIALSDAQEEIAGLLDARKEERVGWIVVCVILFDCALLLNAENSAGPIVIGILQIAALAVLAKRLGVQEFYALFAKATSRFSEVLTGKTD